MAVQSSEVAGTGVLWVKDAAEFCRCSLLACCMLMLFLAQDKLGPTTSHEVVSAILVCLVVLVYRSALAMPAVQCSRDHEYTLLVHKGRGCCLAFCLCPC